MNWDPKPFKVFSYWYEHPDCVPFVTNVWNASNVQGKQVFRFREKLRRLKDNLRGWNHEVFVNLDMNVEEAIKDLNSLDQQVTIEGDNVLNDVSVKRGEAHIRCGKLCSTRSQC